MDDDTCHLSDRYKEYINANKVKLTEKCEQFTRCINELLQEESTLAVLQGENISLRKTCGLMYTGPTYDVDPGNSSTNMQKISVCTNEERLDIQQVMETHLKDKIANPRQWKNVKRCLQNRYGDKERTSHVVDLCKLSYKQEKICKNYQTHRDVETFFNDQIQELKCTCRSLKEGDGDDSFNTTKMLLATGIGGALLVLIICAILFLCYRRRRAKKKKKKSPNVVYLPAPNADVGPIYQELYDDRVRMYEHGKHAPPIPVNPPSIRYTTHPSMSGRSRSDDSTYLEPVDTSAGRRPQLPAPRQVENRGYELPPEYTETDENKAALLKNTIEGAYFEPLPDEESGRGDSIRSKLTDTSSRTEPEHTLGGYDTIASMAELPPAPPIPTSSPPTSPPTVPTQTNADKPLGPAQANVDKPLGPVPAERTKKEDRQTESHYFILEKQDSVEDDKTEATANKKISEV